MSIEPVDGALATVLLHGVIKVLPRRSMTHASAINAFSLLACLAISSAAFAASPAGSPNVLPAESMGVTEAPPPQPINWDRVTQEATDLLSKYIQINTTNPPGNELEAARMLKEKFLTDGVPATTWEPQHGRGIVAARLRGIGKHNKSIILLSHMDVVPANPKEWQVPPFSGLVKNGEIWGRGAIDDKGPGVIELMAMLAIKRAGILLNRDVLFIATGDEEEGGKNGAGWFVDHEASVFSDAGYLLNEGGGIHPLADNKRKVYVVSVTEKTPLWLRLTANGPAGHASDPPAETAVTRLVRALDKLSEYKTPIHVIGPVQDYYHSIAQLDHGPRELLDLASALKNPAFQEKFVSDPGQNAQVRDTITPTVLSASQKTNVISETAYAEIDCRLLPGSDSKTVVNDIKKAIADDSIKIDVLLNFQPISSPSRSPLMNAIETLARVHDQASVVPSMVIGFTDSHYFRQKKIVSYGFIPIEVLPAEGKGIHGINERVGVKELADGIQRMVQLLKIFGGK
ncbi:MAG: M20/M25/M40 family metallo-hydrolase [Candidatus Binatus sp.]|uniref:M20/M25/M40 family metallo-hydrolase n=2 Tax=Candidatus Binatus sp. TaxID=2811406 RepID=UPI003BAE6B18